MSSTSSRNGSRSNGATDELDLGVVVSGRWVAIDLDELLEAVEFVGLPGELIVTYVDVNGRRRYVERCPQRKQRGRRKEVAS